MSFFRFLVTALLLIYATNAAADQPSTIDGGRYGPVRVAYPASAPRAYVVLLSDRGGWNDADQAALQAIADNGILAVGVDLDIYLSHVATSTEKCDQLVGDAESLARQLQHEHGGEQYQFPILVGIGQAGMIVGATLAQAPVNTLSGAASIDPVEALPGPRKLCSGLPATPSANGTYAYGPTAKLNGFWTVAFTPKASQAGRAHIDQLKAAGTPLTETNVFSGIDRFLPHLIVDRLPEAGAGATAALPLVELPAARPTDQLAIVISGDGGWRDLDKTIADELQKAGLNVVGWDSLRYFWREKTPEQTAADLASTIDVYSQKWGSKKLLLVGYSFGADVLPATFLDLPERQQHEVVQMSLLGLASKGDWEITVTGWLGAPASENAVPVMPDLQSIDLGMIQCFYGVDEEDTLCPTLKARGVEVYSTSGGHHYDGNYAALAQRILEGFKRRLASAPSPSSN